MSDDLHVRPYGDDAWLVEVADDRVLATYDALRRWAAGGRVSAREVVPGARTVLVEGLRGADPEDLRVVVESAGPVRDRPAGERVVEVPTTYDGEDLAEVARSWDMSTAEVVSTHSGTDFVVAFCGFSPGFAYCTGLDERLHVPRRSSPRPRVSAGSVGLAGAFTGVYPTASPGGWQLIGRTDLVLWDSEADPPATLSPGTSVRFVDVGGRR